MEVYLDNSATTRAMREVVEIVGKTMEEDYGNPSSMHLKGIHAEKYVRQAGEIIAKSLKVSEKEIYYTSGGTESDNWAIRGAAYANARAGRHLITTRIEHPAVSETMKQLESEGFEVTFLGVDNEGRIRLDELEKVLREDTILVSIMHVNNEVGSLQPIAEAAGIIHKNNPATLFHVDAVQSYGKFRIYPKKWGIDMLSVSGHKIHGPKGVGFLYIGDKTKIRPLIVGGGQQKNYRSGTENVPGIAGLGKAAEMIYLDFEEKTEKLYNLREYFVEEVGKMEGVTVNGPKGREGAPHIVSVSVEGIRSEVLLHTLEEKGIYVSAGSACASNKPAVSETLKAMRVDKKFLDSTLRFSFSLFTTREELEYTLKAMEECLPALRRYTRH